MAHHNIPDAIHFYGVGTTILWVDGQWNITIYDFNKPQADPKVISLTAEQVQYLSKTITYATEQLSQLGKLP